MSSVPPDACHIRWAENEETSPDVCGNSWNDWQLGEYARNTFLEIHAKQLAEWCYLIVVLNTVITKVSVKT